MTILAMPVAGSVVDRLGHRKTTAAVGRSNDPSNTGVGSRLRVKRTALGLSRQELCKQLGIDWDDLDAYEAGIRRVSANLLLRIAKLLNVQPDYFFRDYTEDELEGCLESPID